MKTNLEFFEAKKQITAERKRLNVLKKIRTNLEYLEAKKQIPAQGMRLTMVKK